MFTLEQTAGAATADPTDDAFKFTLVDQVDHLPLNVASGDADASVTVDVGDALVGTDFDGDSVVLNGAVTVNIENDVPLPLTPAEAGITVANEADATGSAALGYFGKVGADEDGTVQFVGTDGDVLQGQVQDGDPALENLKSGGSDIFLFGFTTDTLVASTDDQFDITNFDPMTPDASVVFFMTLNPDGSTKANDLYDIAMQKPIDNISVVQFGSFVSHVASGHTAIVNDIGSDRNIAGSGSTVDVRFSGFVDKSDGTLSTAVDPSVSQTGVGWGQDRTSTSLANPAAHRRLTTDADRLLRRRWR